MSREDDCRACEGWDMLDADGFCPSCADAVRGEPWEVVDRDGDRFSGPWPRDAALAVASRCSYVRPGYTARPVQPSR